MRAVAGGNDDADTIHITDIVVFFNCLLFIPSITFFRSGITCTGVTVSIGDSGNLSNVFLGPDQVPAFDGKPGGEEEQCAQVIDSLPAVKYWIRKVARDSASFWLPTVAGRFYPDFIAQLEDGRLLVVEYKGAHLAEGLDIVGKRRIGKLWQRKSNGRGIFIVVEKSAHGGDMRQQLSDAIEQ